MTTARIEMKTKTKSIAVWDQLSGEEKLLRTLFNDSRWSTFSVLDRAWVPEWNGDLGIDAASRFNTVYEILLQYPHCTDEVARKTANEFDTMGWKNAEDREITNSEWLWKRSRFLAGFK